MYNKSSVFQFNPDDVHIADVAEWFDTLPAYLKAKLVARYAIPGGYRMPKCEADKLESSAKKGK